MLTIQIFAWLELFLSGPFAANYPTTVMVQGRDRDVWLQKKFESDISYTRHFQ